MSLSCRGLSFEDLLDRRALFEQPFDHERKRPLVVFGEPFDSAENRGIDSREKIYYAYIGFCDTL